MNMFWYCEVKVKGIDTSYAYISDCGELAVGSYVEVPFGTQNMLRIGRVESCGAYTEELAPYPVEKTKHIVRIVTKEEYDEHNLTVLELHAS